MMADRAVADPPMRRNYFAPSVSFAPEFTVADIEPDKLVSAKVLSLGGKWLSCMVRHYGGPLWLEEPVTEGGMSGLPTIDDRGRAISVVCSGASTSDRQASLSMNCRLMQACHDGFARK
jgi:hypothetical protein